jgi:copper chaperone CopZ
MGIGEKVLDSRAMRLALTIDGMVAVHARHAVMTALGGVPGIEAAEVELGAAEVTCAPGVDPETTEAALRAAIETVGCTVTTVRTLPRKLPTL